MQISGFTSHLAVGFRRRPGTPHPRLQTLLTAISTGMRLSPVTVIIVPAGTARAWIRTGSHELPGELPDAGQGYRTSSPVTARPMIMRWILEVPPKIVKLSDVTEAEQRAF